MKKKLLLAICAGSMLTTAFAQRIPATLDSVYAPVVVGIPPSDAYIGLSKMPDGELRHYNYGENYQDARPMYLSSKDNGLTWKSVSLPRELVYADQRSPLSGEYIRIFCTADGVYAMRTEGGLKGGRTIVKIDDKAGIMNKPPVFIRGGKRIISGAHRTDRSGAFVYYSDDDGRTWKGFRELLLNPERNARIFGDTRVGEDKSVHQVQAVEVAPGKVLIAVGQHRKCRRMLLFDVDWLYEPGRSCDFSDGLTDWSAFRYYKGIAGHCCYNRQEEPILVQHPDRPGAKLLQLGYTPNDSLVQDNDGAVWNFPASPDGAVSLRIQLPAQAATVNLVLNDRWFNPTDTVARYECMYKLPLTRKQLRINDDKWHEVTVLWRKNRPATLKVDGRKRGTLPLVSKTEHGISYLHLLGERIPAVHPVRIEYVEGGKITEVATAED